jgi:F-type H+-transporting ATPase subunit gamma
MASTRQLKLRIRSVKSTKQITKAMQLVAASKMRRAQDLDKASAPYTQAATALLASLASQGATDDHPLFARREVKTRLLIVVASDKGLVGAYNSNVVRAYLNELRSDETSQVANKTIAIGHKASQFVTRLKGTEVVGIYEHLADQPSGRELSAIYDTALEMFIDGDVDAVDLVFTEFISGMVQRPKVARILPAGLAETDDELVPAQDARYEPDVQTVLDGVARRLVEAQIFQALLDAKASEYSMQMVAMKNATDNASDLVDDLTVEMNKVRQGAITQELAEISGGVEALAQ